MRASRAAALLTGLTAFVAPPRAIAQRDSATFAGVDAAMLDELQRSAMPGGALAIVAGDRIVYAKGYGQSAATGGVPVTPDMLFRIASVTKVFTAATLVTLADAHHVALDAPVATTLGELPEPLRRVTLHQLLSHTAGLTMGPIPAVSADPTTALRDASLRLPPFAAFAPPGEIFSYSNAGYLLAGRAVEVVGGRPYGALVVETVLAPLGMTSTTFDSVAAARMGFARGSADPTSTALPMSNGPEIWPFAGLYSNVHDLAHFAIAFMNGGRYEGRQVLSPATIARISTPAARTVSLEGDYGYGVRVYEHRGMTVVEHGGRGLDGYRSLLYMVPARRIAVIVLGNRAGGRPYAVVDAVLDALVPDAPAVAPPPAVVPVDSSEMARYVGRYVSGLALTVSVDDGVLTLHQGTAALPIRKLADGRFVAGAPPGGLALAFVMDPSGAPKYLHFNMRAFRRQ